MKSIAIVALMLSMTSVAVAQDSPTVEPAETAQKTESPATTPTTKEEARLGPLYHPEGPGDGRWRFGIGGLMDIIPSQVIEAGPPTMPRFVFDARTDVGEYVAFLGSFSSQVVSNELSAGVAFKVAWDHWSFLAGGSFGGYFGTLGQFGFDSTVWGSMVRPTVRLGYSWRDLRVTLNVENWIYLMSYTKLGSVTTRNPGGAKLMAGQASATFESYFNDGSILALGVGAMLAVPDYSLWQVLTDEERRLLYPRFTVTYVW